MSLVGYGFHPRVGRGFSVPFWSDSPIQIAPSASFIIHHLVSLAAHTHARIRTRKHTEREKGEMLERMCRITEG